MENNAQIELLLANGQQFLSEGDWLNAKNKFEEVLALDGKNAKAYLGQLMVELNAKNSAELENSKTPLDGYANFNKALSYADEAYRNELVALNQKIKDRIEESRNEKAYSMAVFAMNHAKDDVGYQSAAQAFDRIPNYKDAAQLKQQCLDKAAEAKKESIYQRALEALKENTASSIQDAIDYLKRIPGYKDADQLLADHQSATPAAAPAEEPAPKVKKGSEVVTECPSLIACPEEKNLVAYQHPATCFNMGATVAVGQNQMAIFMEKDMRIGVFMPGKTALNEDNCSYDIKRDENSDEKFFCTCYFVNMISSKNIKWKGLATVTTATEEGNKYFDAQLLGRFSYEITDPVKFLIWALRYITFEGGPKITIDDLNGMVKATVTAAVKTNFNKVMDRKIKDMDTVRKNLPVIQDDLLGVLNTEMQKMGILISDMKISEINMYSADKVVPDKAEEAPEEEKETPGKKKLRTALIIAVPLLAVGLTCGIVFPIVANSGKSSEPTTSSYVAQDSVSSQVSYSYQEIDDSVETEAAWEDYIVSQMQSYLNGNVLPYVDIGDSILASWDKNEEALLLVGSKAVNSTLVGEVVTAFKNDGWVASSKTSSSVTLTKSSINLQARLYENTDTGVATLKAYYYETFDADSVTDWGTAEKDAFDEVVNGHEIPLVYLGLSKNTTSIIDSTTTQTVKSVLIKGGLWNKKVTSLAETAFENASWTYETVEQNNSDYVEFYGKRIYANVTFGSKTFSDMTVHAAVGQDEYNKTIMVVSYQNLFDSSSSTGTWDSTFLSCVKTKLDNHSIPYFFLGSDTYDVYWNPTDKLMTVRAQNVWDDSIKSLAEAAFDAEGIWTKTAITDGFSFETSYDDLHKLKVNVYKELTLSGYNTILEAGISSITPDKANYTGTYTLDYTTEQLSGNIIHNDDLIAANAVEKDTLVINDDSTYSLTKAITASSENISLSYVFTGKYTITGTKVVKLAAATAVTWSEDWGNFVTDKSYVSCSGAKGDSVKPFGDDGDFYLPLDFFGSAYYYAPANPEKVTANAAKSVTLDRTVADDYKFSY